MKVKLNDAVICRKIFNDILILISILGGIALFDTDLIQNNACTVILVCSSFILGDYIVLLYSANNLKNISLKIANSNFEIRVGDLFEEQGLKVINFNEYFDTLIDNQIIAEKSLNGFFIKNKLNIKVDKLNEIIEQF